MINTQICIDGNCRKTFGPQKCGPGEIVREINSDGTVVCSDTVCDSVKFFNGINADGTPICKSLPTETCGTNQFISNVDATGKVTCKNLPFEWGIICDSGEYIEKIPQGGQPKCTPFEDTLKRTFKNKACGSDQYLRGFDHNGNFICENLVDYSLRRDDIKIETCDAKVGKWLSQCVAKCPKGFFVVGGGCNQRIVDQGSGHRYIKHSFPYDSHSWYCGTYEDAGSYHYYRSATGYAVCVRAR